MSKRILAIVLISALALGTVFAAKGDIRVGLNVGFGHDEMRTSFPGESYLYYNNGLYVAADGSYEIADNVLLDLSAGIMTMGMCQLRINNEGTIIVREPDEVLKELVKSRKWFFI
ncbi:MAG: hypothetical protein J5775_01885, partial [Spirochaetales bacterium]|nr:hypothetical protein [Spirochaetales bacterium]